MGDELLEMQKDTFKRLLIATWIGSAIALVIFWASNSPFGLMYTIWIGIIPLNLGVYRLVQHQFRLAAWLWTGALVGLLTVSIPWNSLPNLGPLPYGFTLIIVISGPLISRAAPLYATGLATLLMPLGLGVTGHWDAEGWGGILPPLLMAWGIAILSWISSEQLVTALEWTHKARLEAGARAEDLRQNRDALEKSLKIRNSLNEQVAQRAVQFEAMAEVSQRITSLLDLDPLLAEVVNLICEKFGYYCASVFLLDEKGRVLMLQAAGGQRGPALLQRGLRLPQDDTSLNGHAASTGQVQRVGDVALSPHVRRDELLPEAISELVIPLRIGQQVVGTLNVQSTRYNDFAQAQVSALQGLADQVAGAIQNTRSFQQTQAALKELELINRLLIREGWQGYVGQATSVRHAEFRAAPLPPVTTGGTEGGTEPLEIPLQVRGQPMGRLTLRREGGAAWSDDEIEVVNAIALQTSLAADNVRLIEQTRHALDEAQALYQTSREITSAGDISEVLSAVLDNLARTGIHAAAVALFDAPTREQAKHIELAGAWDHTGTPRLAPGVRFAIADFPLFGRITSEAALVSQDLLSDPEIDEMAKAVLGGLGFRAMAITPLVARGQWIGILFALVEQAHAFTPSELDFQRALADQAALAIDGRHLLAETERRAEREILIRQITTRIRAASDIQGVLEATATELAQSMRVSRAIVRLTTGNEARKT